MEQRVFYKRFNTALNFFEDFIRHAGRPVDNNKGFYYIFFDKNYRPYLIQTPPEFFSYNNEPELGVHKFHVYTMSTNNVKDTGAIAYLSMELAHPVAFLAKLQILNKDFLRLGIARKLIAFFEYFSFINDKHDTEGVAFPLEDNIKLEDLKNFYEKSGYEATPDYTLGEKFYTITKHLEATQMKDYMKQIGNVSVGNIHFQVIIPKEFSKEPLQEFSRPANNQTGKIVTRHIEA